MPRGIGGCPRHTGTRRTPPNLRDDMIAELRRRDTHIANHLLLALYAGGAFALRRRNDCVVSVQRTLAFCGVGIRRQPALVREGND